MQIPISLKDDDISSDIKLPSSNCTALFLGSNFPPNIEGIRWFVKNVLPFTKINLVISVAVAYNSNPASLDNLEQLIMSVLKVVPVGYTIGAIEKPSVTQIGASNKLVADINVSTYYTQSN